MARRDRPEGELARLATWYEPKARAVYTACLAADPDLFGYSLRDLLCDNMACEPDVIDALVDRLKGGTA